MKDETNFILMLGFGFILLSMNQKQPQNSVNDDTELFRSYKEKRAGDIKFKQAEAKKQAQAEADVRMEEGLHGSIDSNSMFSYGGFKQMIDTRLFGQWQYYQEEYQNNNLKDGL